MLVHATTAAARARSGNLPHTQRFLTVRLFTHQNKLGFQQSFDNLEALDCHVLNMI